MTCFAALLFWFFCVCAKDIHTFRFSGQFLDTSQGRNENFYEYHFHAGNVSNLLNSNFNAHKIHRKNILTTANFIISEVHLAEGLEKIIKYSVSVMYHPSVSDALSFY